MNLLKLYLKFNFELGAFDVNYFSAFKSILINKEFLLDHVHDILLSPLSRISSLEIIIKRYKYLCHHICQKFANLLIYLLLS
jgi:hypothetical protein